MNSKQTPIARRTGIVVKKIDNETLVYDTERHQAHCLNNNAALIWEYCDGNRTISDLSRLLNINDDFSDNQKEQIVRIILIELAKSNLLERPIEEPQISNRITRRQLMKVASLAALLAVPAVTTMLAPTAAQASTCLASGQGCATSAECCSGLCSIGTCA